VEGKTGPRGQIGDDLEHGGALVSTRAVIQDVDGAQITEGLGRGEGVHAVGDHPHHLARAVDAVTVADPVGLMDSVAFGGLRAEVREGRANVHDTVDVGTSRQALELTGRNPRVHDAVAKRAAHERATEVGEELLVERLDVVHLELDEHPGLLINRDMAGGVVLRESKPV
jgi:hypothetical protein